MTTNANMESIARSLSSFWKFPPSDDELELLYDFTRNWTNLTPLAEAIDHASRNMDDRPSVAWLLRESRRRREEAERPPGERSGCILCHDDRWIDTNRSGEGPAMLQACPRCLPTTSAVQDAGAYALDAPPTRHNPKVANIVSHHDAGTN